MNQATHYFILKEDTQILKVYNLLFEIENKQILSASISRIEKGFTNFVVDFSQMDYMNSVGLSFLINLMKKLNDVNGNLVLVNVNKTILQLMTITKVRSMFSLKNSIEEAMKFISKSK